MKATIFTTFLAAICIVIGMYLGGKYLGKGDIVATLCIMGETAIEQNYLNKEQLLELSEKTGLALKRNYPELAETIAAGDRSVVVDMSNSDCTQITGYLIRGTQ
ncbi:MAG: hypothetical protein MI754_10210 [Chromatiales bacterium]|nr:hypothetical protein [Chromatiales bacterium]